ncbi:MAG TPA: DUF4143 domain-containing protein [Bacteroidales bacterium]|nr:hypothetical protein [Bacteroidales bacterium]HRC88533.1 DUF4143 domain-containing protein [Bacteroidales bacterium]
MFNIIKLMVKNIIVQQFTGYLSEPYLFISLPRYSDKIKTIQRATRKFYIIDNGFIRARSFKISPDHGRLLENVFFIELLRRHYRPGLELFYYHTRNGREVDFICRTAHVVDQMIQVCYDITNPKTLKREIDALTEASSELACKNLLLVTWDDDGEIERKGCKIRLLPAWKWLIGEGT